MRAGGCTVQQALTAEAAGVVKQAVSLARRRGNAQVTPLHVASAMLAPPSGLLRAACLRCHSHPLQCKALELCFNVALNRLPTSSAASPLLGGHHHHYCPPSLSNALVAAFKRAQAHQRRGTVESQQQPVLAVKIELEQLVISILDDPSVSRVMREAGFSSTQVKANVEHAMSSMEGHPCSTITTTTTTANRQNPNPTTTTSPTQETKAKLSSGHGREEDATAVLDCLAARSKRRIVVVAECAATTEAAVQAAVERIKGGEAQHEALRGAQLVSLSVSSFRDLPREEAERRLAELRRVVRGSGSLLLVVEDLSWAAEFWAENVERGRRSYYCAVEHVVTEVRALACGGDGLWIVGFGTYQTYMRCRAGQPSLESLWGLQTLTVPAGSLALSLNLVDDSAFVVNQSLKANCGRNGNGNGMTSGWSLFDGSGAAGSQLIATCCGDCSATEKLEPKALMSRPVVSSSSLPSWLQCCRDQEPSHLTDLCKKWSSICSPPSHVMTLNFSTAASPSSSVSSYEHHLHQPWLLADLDAKQPWKAKCQLGAQVNSHDSGASNGSVEVECCSKFKELNAENLKRLCGALEKAVPWQKEIVPEIASTVLRCRSGMAKRRGKSRSTDAREETWLFFLGGDSDGKEKVARELAGLVFGSRKNFLSIGLDSSSPSRSGSTEEHRHKRPRTETSQAYLQRLYEEVSEKPDRVILLEDVEQADRHCRQGIKDAIDSGTVRSRDGDEVGLRDAIVILSCESFDESSRACSPPSKNTKPEAEEVAEEEDTSGHKKPGPSSCFDLNQNAENEAEECCSGDVDLLNAVDRTLFFRIPDEL